MRTSLAPSRGGLATTLSMLVAFRVMQGLGGGGLGPSMCSIRANSGLPLIFIPISTLAYVGMRQGDNNQVSGISNFVRNLGGGIGVSFLVSYL